MAAWPIRLATTAVLLLLVVGQQGAEPGAGLLVELFEVPLRRRRRHSHVDAAGEQIFDYVQQVQRGPPAVGERARVSERALRRGAEIGRYRIV